MHQTSPARRGRQSGQVAPLILVAMAVVTVVLLGVVRLGVAADERARASAAADAAALAGAAEGPTAAAHLAAVNGARLIGFRRVGADVIVTVLVGRMRATARARAEPGESRGPDHVGTRVFP